MRRCEKGEKLHFLQLSNEFFKEFGVRRLLRAPGGDTMFRIYAQAHCAALETGGAIQLHGDLEPAEEIAILIDAPDEEIPMIATTMQYCLKCGLIRTEKNETEDMVVNFTLTGKFTRAWTREALERREKKAQELPETRQEDATALTGPTDQPEETEEAKPEKKKKKPAPVRHRYGEYNNVLLSDEEMEKLKSEFPNDYQKRIENLSGYMASTGRSYKNHLATIRNWARMRGETPATKQTTQTQAPTVPIQERLIHDGLYTTAGILTADAAEKWPGVKDHYTKQEQATIERNINR